MLSRSLILSLLLLVAAPMCAAQTSLSAAQVDSLLKRGHRYLSRGSADSAKALFEEILSASETHHQARMGLVQVAVAEEDWGEALDISEDLLEVSPGDLAAHYYAGVCERELGTQRAGPIRKMAWNRARDHFEAVIARDSLFKDVLYQLARLREYDEDWTEAMALAHRQVLLRPDQADAQIGLFRLYRHYISETDPAEALSWLQSQENNYTRYFVAEVLRRQKQYARAESILVELLQQRSDLPAQACYLSLARMYAVLDDNMRAASWYWNGVDSITSWAGSALIFEDLKYVISDQEFDRYRSLFSDRHKSTFFHEFWRVRDPMPASAVNLRLVEHFRRYVHAEENYEYYGFRARFSNPDRLQTLPLPKAFFLNKEFNDKGVLWLRQGPPNRIERTMGNADIDPYESWLYAAPEGESPRILHFALHNTVSNNWRLTPLPGDPEMLGNLAMWDVRYQRLRHGNALEAMKLAVDLQMEEEKAVASVLESDRHRWEKGTTEFLVPHAIDAFRGARGRTLLDISYAIPLAALRAAAGDTARNMLVEAGISTMSPDGRRLGARVDTLQMILGEDATGSYLGLFRQLVVPDSLHLSLHVRALTCPAVGTWKERLRIHSFTGREFMLSDLQLLLPSSHGPSIEIEGVKVVQSPFTTYRRQKPLFAYAQIYNLVKDINGKAAYTAQYVLARKDDPSEVIVLDEVQRELTDDSRAEFRALDIKGVDPGVYILTLSVTDKKRVQTAKRVREIEITK